MYGKQRKYGSDILCQPILWLIFMLPQNSFRFPSCDFRPFVAQLICHYLFTMKWTTRCSIAESLCRGPLYRDCSLFRVFQRKPNRVFLKMLRIARKNEWYRITLYHRVYLIRYIAVSLKRIVSMKKLLAVVENNLISSLHKHARFVQNFSASQKKKGREFWPLSRGFVSL